MMNDSDKDYILKIKQLESTNIELRQKITDLQNELAAFHQAHNPDLPKNILEYYLKRYLDLHDDELQERLIKIRAKENKLIQELDEIIRNRLELKEASGETKIRRRLDEINQNTKNGYLEIETTKKELEAEKQAIAEKDSYLTQSVIDYYQTLLKYMEEDNMLQTIDYLDFIVMITSSDFYPISLDLINRRKQLSESITKYNDQEKRFLELTKEWKQETTILKEQLSVDNTGTYDVLEESISLQLNNVKNDEQELIDLFTNLKQKNIRQITDIIRHAQIMEKSNSQIASSMDEELAKYEKMLQTIDTNSNIKRIKNMELMELSGRLAILNSIQEEYDIVKLDYDHLQSLYDATNKSIEEIEGYIKVTKQILDASPSYMTMFNKYGSLTDSIKLAIQEQKNLDAEIIKLNDTKQTRILDPFARDFINELNSKIASLNEKKTVIQAEHRQLQQAIEEISSTKENRKLVSIFKERLNCEEKLPLLYDKHQSLRMFIEDKYQTMQSLKSQLKDYDRIKRRLEELENEINN